MINKIRAQEHHHRKLIVYIAAGFITLIIAGIYFYSFFNSKVNTGNSDESIKQTSPAKDLINSLIYVGKEASTAVKEGIEKTKLDSASGGVTKDTETQADEAVVSSELSGQEYITPSPITNP